MIIERFDTYRYSIRSNHFSPALVRAAKSIPGMRFDERTTAWYGYPDAVAVVRDLLVAQGITVTGDLPGPYSWRHQRFSVAWSAEGLRPYQEEGVRFLIANAKSGALLADGMRLGKSCQSTRAARAFKEKTLIIVPSLARGVWARPKGHPSGMGEVARWWPEAAPVYAPKGVLDPQPIPENTMCVVIHNEIVYAWVEALKKWGFKTLIVDECHATLVGAQKSRRGKAITELRSVATYVMFLSGTPMPNRVRDLWPIMEILRPGGFGFFFVNPPQEGETDSRGRPKIPMAGFSNRYCGAFQFDVGVGPDKQTYWNRDGASEQEELHRRMQYFMLRRIKSEVDDQLPEKTRQIIDVDIAPGRTKPPTFGITRDKKELRRALDLAADAKIRSVVDLLKMHLLEGSKVVCFTYRRKFAERIVSGIRAVKSAALHANFIHGNLPQAKRDARITQWRELDGAGLLCATYKTASMAINLAVAPVAVFAEFTHEPANYLQAEERLYEFGGRKTLMQYVAARGTTDELIMSAVVRKLDTFDAVVGKGDRDLRSTLAAKKTPRDALAELSKALEKMIAAKAKGDE